MSIEELVAKLSDPRAWPRSAPSIEVRQTHISVVFLGGADVYKLKKPVRLPFVDFSTLENRRQACAAEVRLNRRLAPDVYLGVVAVVARGDGLAFDESIDADAPAGVVDWAVHMRRLLDDDSMLSWFRRGALTADRVVAVAKRLAEFHALAERGPRVASCGGLAVVSKNARDNFAELAGDAGAPLARPLLERLREKTEESLARLGPLIEKRAAAGIPCDGHGDLRLEHIYFEPAGTEGGIVVIDCVEFNERFRMADPIADIAFLAMELAFHGRRDLANAFVDAYLAPDDREGRVLLPFYVAYRSIVRSKVHCVELGEPELDDERKRAALAKAKSHLVLALGTLEDAPRRPALVLMGGLPGTGKTTLARALAARAGFEVLRSDVVRSELFPREGEGRGAFGEGRYAPELVTRTYQECRMRAEQSLVSGGRVIVDATFAAESERRAFLALARACAVPLVWLVCRADSARARERLAQRKGDASDADAAVYDKAKDRWEPPSEETRVNLVEIDTNGGEAQALARALSALEARGLWIEPA